MKSLGYTVEVKHHSKQQATKQLIEGVPESTGNFFTNLIEQNYDVVVTDISTAMNDIIFFKNRAIYFSPPGNHDFYTKNIYSEYLFNGYERSEEMKTKEDLYSLINIEKQEALLDLLVNDGDNDLNNL